MKSFRRTGTRAPADGRPEIGDRAAEERAVGEDRDGRGARARAYSSARSAGSRSSRIDAGRRGPALHLRDDRHASASGAPPRTRAAAPRRPPRARPPPRRARRAGRPARVEVRIWSRVTGILSFGRSSGILVRALFGRHRRRRRMLMPLTKRQSEILAYLQHHIHDQGYAPSFEEIAEQFGFQSLATVHEHLTNLERKGYIRRSYNESRSIEVLPPRGTSAASEIPLLGKVAAGTPIESLMHQETIAVPDQMLPRRGPNYALTGAGHLHDRRAHHGRRRRRGARQADRRERRDGHRPRQRQRGHGEEVLSRGRGVGSGSSRPTPPCSPCASRSGMC